jgi:hypothetical protein
MSAVEEITVKVPSEVAEAYRKATEDERQQMAARIGVILRSRLGKAEAITKLRQTINEISEEAQSRGLTPGILESMLTEEGWSPQEEQYAADLMIQQMVMKSISQKAQERGLTPEILESMLSDE